MPRKIVKTTQSNINKMTSSGGAKRVGFTVNPTRRASEYSRSGINGTMYVASTDNGRKSENRLLSNQFSSSSNHKNVQARSNISDGKSGFVYAIKK